MGVVVVTEPLEGEVTAIADVNNTLTAWNTQSTAIESANIRDEGFDRRPFPELVLTPADGTDSESSATAFGVISLIYAVVNPGGVPMRVGPVDNSIASDQCEVHATFIWCVPGDAAATRTLSVQLWQSIDNITYNAIAVTQRPFRMDNSEQVTDARGSCTISHYYTGAKNATQYFELRAMVDVNRPAQPVSMDEIHIFTKVTTK